VIMKAALYTTRITAGKAFRSADILVRPAAELGQRRTRMSALRLRGFSLVEVLVAVALLSIIVVALMAAFQQTQRAFRAGAGQSDVLEAGRAVMTIISRDVQETTFSGISNGYNFYVAPNGKAMTMGPELLLLENFFCLTRRNDEWIVYKYSVSNAFDGVGTLYRKQETVNLTNLEDICKATYAMYFDVTNDPGYHRIADGIVHFRIVAPTRPTTNQAPIIGIETSVIPNTPFFNYTYSYTNLPEYVELELGILEPDTLKNMEGRTLTPADAAAYLASKAGRIHLFRQRIPIRIQSRLDL
jgi:prepilin-type N-terminal cleavage/methylation domain-containing protein